MSNSYILTSTGTLDAESLLTNISDLKTLFNIEFVQDSDNILLLKKIIILLYERLTELESSYYQDIPPC